MKIAVWTGHTYIDCETGNSGRCRYCGQSIMWTTTPNGRKMPVQPWSESAIETESHFSHCTRQTESASSARLGRPPQAGGILMTERMWRHLLLLVHPDRHHGGDRELLANEVTKWLLQQRWRLTRENELA
jgi:hypothetical protein